MKKQQLTIKQLKERYESLEYKAYIDEQGFTKSCTAGSGASKHMLGCGGRILPLYEFPLIKQYSDSDHQYEPDQDGLMRRNSCKDCMKAYQRSIARERRSQIFNKDEAIADLIAYGIRNRLDVESAPTFHIVKADSKREYKFLELEAIKSDIKKELI